MIIILVISCKILLCFPSVRSQCYLVNHDNFQVIDLTSQLEYYNTEVKQIRAQIKSRWRKRDIIECSISFQHRNKRLHKPFPPEFDGCTWPYTVTICWDGCWELNSCCPSKWILYLIFFQFGIRIIDSWARLDQNNLGKCFNWRLWRPIIHRLDFHKDDVLDVVTLINRLD